jgi:hypothetical protein
MTGGLVRSVSSIPSFPQGAADASRGGETEPTRRPTPYFCRDCGRRFYNLGWHAEACGSPNFEPIEEPARSMSRELRRAFMAAHRAWAEKHAAHLLEAWLP